MADDDGEGEDDDLEARVLSLARGGHGRTEIAAALGFGEAELTALEAARPGLALAMQRAAVLERAWWEALPREGLAGSRKFNLAGWLAAMRWRWGDASPGSPPKPAPPGPTARCYIPDNGRERRRSMPDSYYRDRDPAWLRDEEIREADADVRRAEESLEHTMEHVRDEERVVAERRARLAWLREAPLDAEEPDEFLPEDEEDEDDDGWK